MAEWEIELGPDEVKAAVIAYVKEKYKVGDGAKYEAINDWPYIAIKMGKYPPKTTKRT